MSDYLIDGQILTDIANAIRTKLGGGGSTVEWIDIDLISPSNSITIPTDIPIEDINVIYGLLSDGTSYIASGTRLLSSMTTFPNGNTTIANNSRIVYHLLTYNNWGNGQGNMFTVNACSQTDDGIQIDFGSISSDVTFVNGTYSFLIM